MKNNVKMFLFRRHLPFVDSLNVLTIKYAVEDGKLTID